MKIIYGISSVTPINKRLKNGYTMYDWVKRQKCFPAFCMRNLCGEDVITEEEINFLKSKDCRIGFVIRDLTEARISGINGADDAIRAVTAAKALGVPRNRDIALFAEVKPQWSINHNWMIGFAQALVANGYVPGFIGNTDSSKNFNFDRQCSHYVQATSGVNQFGAVYCATEPKCANMPEEWKPYCPSALQPEDMQLWMSGETVFDNIRVDDIYTIDEKVLKNMW